MKKRQKILALGLAALVWLAGSMAHAALEVNVMPSGSASQANIWDSKGPYTWPGNALELWGNVAYDGSGTLTYVWDFGAGEGTASGAVTNRGNIAATHTYGATGSYVATLTVTDGSETDSDTVFIDVVPRTLAVEKNLAIQRGMKYLYMHRANTTVYGCPAYFWDHSNRDHAMTGLALMSFMNHGHLEFNDPTGDIYAETVAKGLKYIFAYLYPQTASMNNTTYTDSDINGNSRKLYTQYSHMYDVGIIAMTVAATLSPAAIIGDCGAPTVRGNTYKEVLEDLVDYIAFAQREGTSGHAGGWRYTANYGNSDGSVTQWPVLGLGEAQNEPWNINAPSWVKTRMAYWMAYIQHPSNGGFGYTYNTQWLNIAKTGAGVACIAYAGTGGNLGNAIGFINANWGSTTNDYGNIGDHYAMYAVKKGMEYAGLSTVGAHDWQAEYDQWLVNNQYKSGGYEGTWPGSVRINLGNLSCAFGLLVMAPLEACKPLADAGIDQEVGVGQPVNFDGSGSSHTCPDTGAIVAYEWDFDYDGIIFDVDATGALATNPAGYTITNSTDTQIYTVALRVRDNDGKISTDTLKVTVDNGNLAPVADPGGPYLGAVGEDITLDASGSYDNNSQSGPSPLWNPAKSKWDEIELFQWDVDGDNLYGTEDSPAEPEGETAILNFGPAFIGTKVIGLKVTDSFGKTAAQSSVATTVAISNLYPEGYELISRSYNRRTRIWTYAWKMRITNTGNADATDVTAVLTPDNIPPGVTVLDDSLSWTVPDNVIEGTDNVPGGEIQLSDDTFSYRVPRGASAPDLTQMTWDIEFTDDLGTRHVVRKIPQ